jgi:hypothetical protein
MTELQYSERVWCRWLAAPCILAGPLVVIAVGAGSFLKIMASACVGLWLSVVLAWIIGVIHGDDES